MKNASSITCTIAFPTNALMSFKDYAKSDCCAHMIFNKTFTPADFTEFVIYAKKCVVWDIFDPE